MQYIDEIPVAALVSHTVDEDDAAPYNPLTSYVLDARVLHEHRVYRSMQAANTGHTPGIPASLTWWEDEGPSNRWAMFDDELATATTAVGGFSFELATPQGVESVAFLKNAGVHNITVEVLYGSEVLYPEQTFSMLDTSQITDWWTYYYGEWPERSELILLDLPGIPGATLKFAVEGDGEVSVGMFKQGKVVTIGEAEWKPVVGIDDYSTVVLDKLGKPKITERGFGKIFDVRAEVESNRFDLVTKALQRAGPRPKVWIAGGGLYDALIAYGTASWKLTLDNVSVSYGELKIKGFIQ